MAEYTGSITLAAISDGQNGATGPAGIGVSNIVEQYALSTSSSSAPSSGWGTTYTWEDGKYLWTRSAITWTNSNISYTDAILAAGINNANQTASNAYTYADSVASSVTSINSSIQEIWDQLDGQIESWYEEVDPTLSNVPAVDWTTPQLKAQHVGDLYYNLNNGHSWRWLETSTGVYDWVIIPDSDAAQALAKANEALSLAGTKKRIFTAQPSAPYDIGDLWVDGSVVKYCTIARAADASPSYLASEWTLTATDDSAANAAMALASAA